MRSVTVHEAKANLSKLIERARRGEEVIIARGATPVFRLVPVGEVQERRPPAALRGKLRVGPELGHFKTAYRASFQRLVSIGSSRFAWGCRLSRSVWPSRALGRLSVASAALIVRGSDWPENSARQFLATGVPGGGRGEPPASSSSEAGRSSTVPPHALVAALLSPCPHPSC